MKSPDIRFIDQNLAYEFVMPRLSVTALVIAVLAIALCAWAALDAGSLVGWMILGLKSAGISVAGIGTALYVLRYRYIDDCVQVVVNTARDKSYNVAMPDFVYDLYNDKARQIKWRRLQFVVVASILAVAVYYLSARELIVFFSAAAMFTAIIGGGAFGGPAVMLIFAVALVAAVSSWSAAVRAHGSFTGTIYQAVYWLFAVLTACPLIGILQKARSDNGSPSLYVMNSTQHGFVIGTLCGVGFARAAEQTQSAEEGFCTAEKDRDPEIQAGAVARGQVADSDALAAKLNQEQGEQ